MSKKKIKYQIKTELANYVLSEFIDPLAGANKYNDCVIPYNFNEALNHIYSKTGVFEHPFSFTKQKLQDHLLQEETHYYRSCRTGVHKVFNSCYPLIRHSDNQSLCRQFKG